MNLKFLTGKGLISAALIITCYGFPANAQTISSETVDCGKAASKAGALFSDKIADSIERCLLKVLDCRKKQPGQIQGCADQLLLPGGQCATGKLAPAGLYYGSGSASNVDGSFIGKAYSKYQDKLAKCTPSFVSLIDYSALGFPSATYGDLVEVIESLNNDPDGVACAAHKRVLRSIPARNSLLQQLQDSPNAANFPLGVRLMLSGGSDCK